MTRTKEILRGLARLLSCDARATRIRTPRTPALSWAALEGRIVPSSFGGGFAEVASFGQGHGRGPQRGGGSPGGFGGSGGSGSGGGETSSAIGQDARAVQQDYQTFESAYESAVAALRLTATATTGPSADGLTAFNAAIATAIGTLNTSIGSDLSHLTTTGSAVSATIEASNATLETEIESAATGLANSTNSAVLALNRETRSYLRDAQGAATSAILGDSATGSLSSAVIKTFNQAVGTASQTFRSSIHSAVQTSISAGTALSSSALTSAASTLESALTSALTGLGTAFTSSASDPSSTIATEVGTLTTDLEAITAPTAGDHASEMAFARAVSSVLAQDLGAIDKTMSTAVQDYNNSLL